MRRMIFTALMLLAAVSCIASIVVLVSPGPDRRVRAIVLSANTLEYLGNTNALINPVITNAATLLVSRWTNGVFVQIPQSEFDAEAALQIAIERTNTISRAARYFDELSDIARAQRAIALMTLDQINRLRASNGLSMITTQQFINAVSNTIRADTR